MNLFVESFAGLLSLAVVSVLSFQSFEFIQAIADVIAQIRKH
ncbi:hypothetical protein [Alteribacter aurantiacus]|nr:hypothetical protein [Alteribacter aurantiacus]